MNEKLYQILNDKLFDISILYKVRELEFHPPRSMPISSATKGIETQFFNPEIWKTYLGEMGIVKLVLSGWFRNENLEGGSLEESSFIDPQGQKVDPKWIEDNLVIKDPLDLYHKVLVPTELAMKVLALGYFPDSPSIQKMRESS
ncbi:MAG: hypothetical protein EBS53_09405 [Bacteroidetes bacterium]|nr:hypothetical protein [Bacteroidota bacterium]